VANLVEIRGTIASHITDPIVAVLGKSRLKPNILTFIGLAISIGAAYAIVIGYFLLGGALVLVSGLFDLLDGALARFTKQSTKFGAILDSTIDRLSEAAIFCGLLVWYMSKASPLAPSPVNGEGWDEVVLIFAALIGSFLVSYIRARAEGLGLECRVGLFTRAERVIVLAVGLLVNQVFIALWGLVVFVYITVAQRLLYLRKQAKVRGG
jgi:CDP-diacylglycerol--glycerol-3-phosphate 3-phosphatidyltransferase